MTTKLLKTSLLTTLLSSLIACSPTKQNSVQVGANSSSIIGGVPVSPSDVIAKSTVAIIALVRTPDGQEGQFICTGSLMASDIVLTAGHCVPEVGEEFSQVMMFVVFNTELQKMQKSDIRVVVDSVVHPEYGSYGPFGEDAHDLALIKFAGGMAPGYQVAKFLEDESVLTEGKKVTLAGYGLIETDGVNEKSDDRLRKVDVEIIESFGQHEVLLDQTQGKGACHGDSGGPAFIEVNGTQYVWGVTSRGAGKDGVDDCSLVSVYTKIKSEAKFIHDALKKLGK